MNRTKLAAAVVALAGALSMLLASPAQAATWKRVGCAPTVFTNAHICFYYDAANPRQAQGRFVNNSSVDIKNLGFFWKYNSTTTNGCAESVTRAGTTSTCTRSLTGTWYLADWVNVNGSLYFAATATHTFG